LLTNDILYYKLAAKTISDDFVIDMSDVFNTPGVDVIPLHVPTATKYYDPP